MNIAGIIHILLMIFLMSYFLTRMLIPVAFRKNVDASYIFVLYFLVLSWMIFSDQCIISILYIKLTGNSDIPTAEDVKDVIGPVYQKMFFCLYYLFIYATALYLFIFYGLTVPGVLFLFMMFIYILYTQYDENNKKRIMDEKELEFMGIKIILTLVTVYAIVCTSIKMF